VDDVTQNGSEVQKLTWGYDAAGNRLSSTVLGGEHVSYTYGGGNELLSKNDGTTTTTYSYDGNGNLLGSSPNGASSTYNPKNQTTKIGSDSFTYSGAGQKDLVQINADTAVYTGLGLSTYTDGGTTSHYVRCSCGLLNDERTPDGKKYYYLFDGLGSIAGMTDSTGSEVNRYDYDPYGVMLHQQEQSGFTNLFKFAGGQYRSSTGLYKFGQRYYNPNLGRWTQLDPAGTGYVYAGDNPVNAVDPSGTYTFAQWWFVLGSCLASSVIAPFLALATLLGVGAAVWAAIAAIASATAPAWLPWVVLVGGALVFAVVLGCAAFATLNTWRFFE
jgi:RHS repeat-associated protein